MQTVKTIAEAREVFAAARGDGKSVGLVPTMGALHEGHMTLVRQARAECGFVVVSVFVNPTQFGPSEDLARYPRDLSRDADLCSMENVDLIFVPEPEEMYPQGFDAWVEVGGLTDILEGASRPGHFRGVTTVCAKLFNIIQPDRAYFGAKDYQQLKVIQKMVRDLDMPLEIVTVDIVRESSGLAMSSRNAYLSPEERESALVLSKALTDVRSRVESGERSADIVQEYAENLINAELAASIDYVAVVDAETLQPISQIERNAVMLLAVRIGKTRLIDNTVLSIAP